MSTRVHELIEEFAGKLEDALKQDLRDAIERLGLGIEGSHRNAKPPRASGHMTTGARNGVKRDAAALDGLSQKFVAFVTKHPGLRIEQINRQLGTTTKSLALPIRKLIADGSIKARGQKRSTTYELATGRSGGGKRRKS
jgi:hypothetical protein